jgi:hypothetical protein
MCVCVKNWCMMHRILALKNVYFSLFNITATQLNSQGSNFASYGEIQTTCLINKSVQNLFLTQILWISCRKKEYLHIISH